MDVSSDTKTMRDGSGFGASALGAMAFVPFGLERALEQGSSVLSVYQGQTQNLTSILGSIYEFGTVKLVPAVVAHPAYDAYGKLGELQEKVISILTPIAYIVAAATIGFLLYSVIRLVFRLLSYHKVKNLIREKLDSQYHHLIKRAHIQKVLEFEGLDFYVKEVYGETEAEKSIVSDIEIIPILSDDPGNRTPSSLIEDSGEKNSPGGIDMNDIDIQKQGNGIDVQFSYDSVQPIPNMNIDGFAPVIMNLIPVESILPLLGL